RIPSSRGANVDGDDMPRNPIRGTLPGCCARAASGHAAAAPLQSVMNSRRLMLANQVPPALAPPVGLPHAQPAAEGPGNSLGHTRIVLNHTWVADFLLCCRPR